jgi:hypothetical protein
MKKEDVSFKCPNELRVTVKKEKETIIDEDCCTMLNIMLKNDGQLGTSFFGSHNPQIIKILEITMKKYFKNLKKTFKQQYKDNQDKEEIKIVNEDLPEDMKMKPNLDESKTQSDDNQTKDNQSKINNNKNSTKQKQATQTKESKINTSKSTSKAQEKSVQAKPKKLNNATKIAKKDTK